ncbi:MAG: hypothetical protein BRC29_03500 [Nanohaloarchaea archaeon SW_7_43_1]|nr:MAG: hypothetical protein BRC29_03500 [Nanohaloarchaea archaeon SW_7_43_1]
MEDTSTDSSTQTQNGLKSDDILLRAEKQDGSYSDRDEYILYSYDGGFEIVYGESISVSEFEKLKDEGEIVKFSENDLSNVLTKLLRESPEGIF